MTGRRLLLAARLLDGDRTDLAPGALLLEDHPEGLRVMAVGAPEAVGTPEGAAIERYDQAVLTPSFVNAHAHLDLTAVGPVAFDDDFPAWLAAIRTARPEDEAALAASVVLGARRSLAGGVSHVADIAGLGSSVPADALRSAAAGGLAGTSHRELLGFGDRVPQALAGLEDVVRAAASDTEGSHRVRLGLQPHAPYSCGAEVFRRAAESGLPVSTHLAETPEEVRFSRTADGPMADLLRRLGVVFDPAVAATGQHPIDALADALAAAPWLCAHVNEVEPHHFELLASWDTTVAFCPRATACFGRSGPPWRAMREAGVRVALGTDGVPCLDRDDRISTLDEARWLRRSGAADGLDPRELLAMATVAGAEGLGVDPDRFRFTPGSIAGVLAHPAASGRWIEVLDGDAPPIWVAGPGRS